MSCGHHTCSSTCHEGDCSPCSMSVDIITHCPCGRQSLEHLYEIDASIKRTQCTDPIPTCSNVCQRQLQCGQPGKIE